MTKGLQKQRRQKFAAMLHRNSPKYCKTISASAREMEDIQQRPLSLVMTSTNSSLGSSTEGVDYGEMRFKRKHFRRGPSYTCIIITALFVSLATILGVYFGLQIIKDDGRGEHIYKGSFVVLEGDKYSNKLSDSRTEEFRQRAMFYKSKLEDVFRNSVYKEAFHHAEILALNRRDPDWKLVVYFNLHISPREVAAADIHRTLVTEALTSETGVFQGLKIDKDSIEVQERGGSVFYSDTRIHSDDQLEMQDEGTTTPAYPTSISPSFPHTCTFANLSICHTLPYNSTSYPNLLGHKSFKEMEIELAIYRQILQLNCYSLGQEFLCHMLQPECLESRLVVPCREYCQDFWKSCRKSLPKSIRYRFDCKWFPKYTGKNTCRLKPGCANDMREQGKEERLCDGVIDCPDYSDEAVCEYCSPGQIFCGNRQCVDKDKRCDGRPDCFNGRDEKSCLTITPSLSILSKQPFYYYKEGYLVYNDRGALAKICTDNLNFTLPSTRRDIILQSLAVSTCSTLNYEVTENVEMRRDHEDNENYVQMVDPLASSVAFAQVPCQSRYSIYVKCGATACGIRPALSARGSQQKLNVVSRQPVHGEWPWHVSLFRNGQHACDGTLITDGWLLASTACFEGSPYSTWTARLGMLRISANSPFEQATSITGIVRSPVGGGNVALAKLDIPANGSDFIRPSCLPGHNHSVSEGLFCIALGWINDDQLVQTKLVIRNTWKCQNITLKDTNTTATLHTGQITCAENVMSDFNGHCTYKEAVGSPLHCLLGNRWYLMGVSDREVTCGQMNHPRIFHPTFEHVQWIHQTLDSLRIPNNR